MLPRMPFRRRLRTFALVGCIAAVGMPNIGLADETWAANVAAARKHFEKARAYYGQGAYREAVNELEAAHVLDPNAKDLVFNLGVVHEKLSDIDEALNWFRLYTTMDLVAQERDRADAYIRRLEGAKRELEEKLAAQQQLPPEASRPSPEPTTSQQAQKPSASAPIAQPSVPPQPPSQPPAPTPQNGRVDALTLSAAGVSVVALAVGTVLAVKAESEQPTGFVTGRDGTYSDLVRKADLAKHDALGADIAFGAALVSGITTAYLYFGRSRPAPLASGGTTTISAGPLSGGATLFVKGCF
jgi:tetratricopeptide (TPR) repeat protein